MRINFLLVLVLALVGCDDGEPESMVNGDAGCPDAVKSDVIKSSDVQKVPCVVPAPKYTLGGAVSTVPRGGYRIVSTEAVQCTSLVTGGMQPTNCADPVDGFAANEDSPWCCVYTTRGMVGVGSDAVLSVVSPILACYGTVKQVGTGIGPMIPGDVALCSPSGKFVGWAC
jgi:hypothetical protein